MKIKLGILTKDTGYSSRLISALTSRHAEEFEMFSFTEAGIAFKESRSQRLDVLLVEEQDAFDVSSAPDHLYIVYLVESRDIETVGQSPVIFKYQKTELIVKQIWSLYAEVIDSSRSVNKKSDSDCKIIGFASPCGGCGSSTMAAVCAVDLAKHNKRVMYLNLEKISSADVCFRGDGMQNLSDIILTLKGKKANLAMKIEACLRQDSHGVAFFSESNQILDMYEMSTDEQVELIQALLDSGMFDYLILDLDFDLTEAQRKIYYLADTFVITAGCTAASDEKLKRAYQAMKIQEQNQPVSLLNHAVLVYNQCSNPAKAMPDLPLKVLCNVPYFHQMPEIQILEQVSAYDFFGNL